MSASLSPEPAPTGEFHRNPASVLPSRPFRLTQRWTRLLFAHWPMRPDTIQARLPNGLTVDTFDGSAWLGVVPFLMDRVRVRTVGRHTVAVPAATAFPELNLRTYVRAPDGAPGVYFFSLDAGSLLAVLGARVAFGLPYFWSRMHAQVTPPAVDAPKRSPEIRAPITASTSAAPSTPARRTPLASGEIITYTSDRLLGGTVRFHARYRSLGTPSPQDDLRHFLTERYALFLRRFGAVQIGHIHHHPWQLQAAEAEFVHNDLPAASGFRLPHVPPLLHYGPEVHMQAWTLRRSPPSAPPGRGPRSV